MNQKIEEKAGSEKEFDGRCGWGGWGGWMVVDQAMPASDAMRNLTTLNVRQINKKRIVYACFEEIERCLTDRERVWRRHFQDRSDLSGEPDCNAAEL